MAKEKLEALVIPFDRIVAAVAERMGWDERLSERIETMVDQRVTARLAKVVDAEIERAARKEIEAIVEKGWLEAVPYGEPKKHTVAARVAEFFEKKVGGDHYNRTPARTAAETIIADVIEKNLRADFVKEGEAAVGRFREAVDEVIKAKLTETLKTALGLR